ncbi:MULTISPECIES: hypothetical protein [unclassified Paraburkholderia]|uniref:hypothetical protein n=1 Tax=unclassified Paraburkholderia TaxID=2615204 RepID=UPI00160E0D1A|nr:MULTISPECIES: hypothetical protein [unclassified Paraburkholderia]MBB5443387.1 hypothetical protein [Paraburkholderia sp. WSM4177]MBB5484392.1 hypothetical protein [Paraburkholderia sp. WSM4180]
MKPMLRIVNMQRRLRPVYPGFDAIDFAMDLRDLRRPDTTSRQAIQADCGKFRDIITDCIQRLQTAFDRAAAILQFLPATLVGEKSQTPYRCAS